MWRRSAAAMSGGDRRLIVGGAFSRLLPAIAPPSLCRLPRVRDGEYNARLVPTKRRCIRRCVRRTQPLVLPPIRPAPMTDDTNEDDVNGDDDDAEEYDDDADDADDDDGEYGFGIDSVVSHPHLVLNLSTVRAAPRMSMSVDMSGDISGGRFGAADADADDVTQCAPECACTTKWAAGTSSDPNFASRKSMEDALISDAHFVEADGASSALYAVFDGHGGPQVAMILKRHFRHILREHLTTRADDMSAALTATFDSIDSRLRTIRRFARCGSTAAVCLIRQTRDGAGHNVRDLFFANVGDSATIMVYRTPQPRPRVPLPQISRAQSVDDAARKSCLYEVMSYAHTCYDVSECERIRQSGGHVFLNRVNGTLAVTRSFGDNNSKAFGVSAAPFIKHIRMTECDGETRVVLACDGVWDVMTADDVADLVNACGSRRLTCDETAESIIKESLNRGTTDNVSCIVVQLGRM